MTTKTTPQRRAGTLQAVVLLFPCILVVMAVVALAPALPELMAEFGDEPGGKWLVPMILTVPAVCMIFFAPIAGMLGDRFGRRTLLIASLFVYSLVGLAPMLLHNLQAILVSRIAVGIAEAFALTLSTTMISDYFTGRERDKWLGYQTGVASIAAVILVVLGGALGRFGWRGSFAVYAIPMIFALLVIVFTWETERRQEDHEPIAASGFPWGVMLRICAVTFFAAVAFYIGQVQAGVVLEAVGVQDPARRGMFQAIATVGTLMGTFLFGFISIWPVSRLLLLGFCCIGLGYLGVGNATTGGVLTAAMTLAQVGCGLLLPTLLTWAIRNLSFEFRARGTGLWQGVFSFGQFVCAPLFILAADQSGGVLPGFSFFGILNVIAACLTLMVMFGLTGSRKSAPAAM